MQPFPVIVRFNVFKYGIPYFQRAVFPVKRFQLGFQGFEKTFRTGEGLSNFLSGSYSVGP
jgi:hypothetical protein